MPLFTSWNYNWTAFISIVFILPYAREDLLALSFVSFHILDLDNAN